MYQPTRYALLSFGLAKTLFGLALCIGAGLWGGHALQRMAGSKDVTEVTANNEAFFRGESSTAIMFGTSTCPWCAKTRALLTELRVPFKEILVDQSVSGRELYQTLNAPGVPVVLIGDKRIYGFDEARIREAVAQALRNHPLAVPQSGLRPDVAVP